jgi:heptaprenyl diphosphate synthase
VSGLDRTIDHWAVLPVQAGRAALEAEIARALAPAGGLDAENGLLMTIARDLLDHGGKRLRPALALLAAEAGPGGATTALPFAAACEILHNATLIHDDVIDGAALRRGKPTVAARWGNRVALLAGDYLFARALTLVAQLGRPEVSVRLGRTVEHICQAEIEQIARAYDLSYSEPEYLELVRRKSALLIAECCRSGALLGGAAENVVEAMFAYGQALGTAFQIADDILDVVAADASLGKPTGQDIQLGLLTLPVLRALESQPALRPLISRRMEMAGDVSQVLDLVRAGDGVAYARARAEHYILAAQQALAILPSGEPRDSLVQVARFAVRRDH